MIKNEFMTISEFAAMLKVHPNSVRNMIKKGKISAFKIGVGKTSSYRIPKSETQRLALFNLEEIVQHMVEKRLKELEE